MLNKILVVGLYFLFTFPLFAQEKFVLNGSISDSANGENLIGASIYIKESNSGAVTNSYGYYSLTLPQGVYTLTVSYLGYQSITRKIDMSKNIRLDFSLREMQMETKEVVVLGERKDAQVKNLEMGTTKLEMKTINAIPPLLGEVDVIRSIQLLPGVSSVGEGATGFNVRGGGIDQNLVLIDEAPVYNSAHLLGFFSVFNPDAVKDVKLSKAAIPAQYGGRLSSVLDVRMKEGNMKRLAVQGGVGLIFSRLTVEGPLKKDKASFIVAARRSYADVLFRPFIKNSIGDVGLYFYDLTAKVNYVINEKNRVFWSGYLGRDVWNFPGASLGWGNATTTVRWNHLFSSKLFMNLTGYYSNYDFRLKFGENNEDSFEWTARIINNSLKPDFTWYINDKNTLSFGGQSIYYKIIPSDGLGVSRGSVSDISLPNQFALENAVYVANEQKLTPRVTLQYGLRYSFFTYLGPGTVYTYPNVAGNFKRYPISSLTYNDWVNIKTYSNPEPRASINYSLNEKSSIKASYNRMAQYIHLVSNTNASIPIDTWTPSTPNIQPQKSDQYSLGYFRSLGKDNQFQVSVEGFYKDMWNQLDYIDGANLRFNRFLEGELISGKGRSYGMEFYVRKSEGRFTGWLSYTLSRSERQVQGINNNNWYANKFDRTHNLSSVAMYELGKRWSLSSTFTYQSGTPFNFANQKYAIQDYWVGNNSDNARNNFRMTAYHRFDISATLKSKDKERNSKIFKNYSWELVFGVYNLYGRRNPFSFYPKQNPDIPGQLDAYRLSIIGAPIPSFTYNFKF